MGTLIFDIETAGENFNELDQTTQDSLTRWIKRESISTDEFAKRLEDLKDGLGFSPLTSQIVAIGVLDYEKDKGAVYFQDPKGGKANFEANDFIFKPMTEKEMLEHFWQGIAQYQNFVSFDGRAFDVPFLALRSAVHKIKPSRNLMTSRYLSSQPSGVKHIDLVDQLTFYGALRKKGSLHLWCRAFGIKSPKAAGVTGDDVKQMFSDGRGAEIAKYNAGDLRATKELYEYWKNYVSI